MSAYSSRLWYHEHAAVFRDFGPTVPPGAVVTYNISQPVETHYREASCVEVDCFHARAGWRTIVDTATPTGATQANYIRLHSGRHYTWHEGMCRINPEDDTDCLGGSAGTLVVFHFAPGQKCFATHRVPLGKPATFRRAPGDWRGLTGDIRTFTGRNAGADWVDDFATNQQKIADAVEKG